MIHPKQIRIRYFIWLGYLIPFFFAFIAAFSVGTQAFRVLSSLKELDRSMEAIELTSETSLDMQITLRAARDYLLEPNSLTLETFKEANQDIKNLIPELQEVIVDQKQVAILNEINTIFSELDQINRNLLNLAEQGKIEEAIQLWKAQDKQSKTIHITELFHDFLDEQATLKDLYSQELKKALLQSTYIVLSLSISYMVISLFFGRWIVDWMVDRLNRTTDSLAASSNEIVTTVEQQERIASQQALSVNDTTTTMEELDISARQSAEQAEAASQAARQVLSLAEAGRQTVSKTIDGMDLLRHKVQAIAAETILLNEETNRIGNISQLVSDLANQTNMLALNAAVEAVRAGNHGKGFSVVASEIRKLADQSRQSAGQISSLVGNIQNAIKTTVNVTNEGTQTVESTMVVTQQTAAVFSDVTSAINEVVKNNQQISFNIQQQAGAIQRVASVMVELNQGAKENAAGISQTRINIQSLDTATQELQTLF